MYERVLVPIDGSFRGDVALEYASRIAALSGAPMDVLKLVESVDGDLRVQTTSEKQIADIIIRESTVTRTVRAAAGDEIASESRAEPNTLVVMATAARGRLAGLVGSVAEDVLASIATPVLLVGPDVEMPTDEWPSDEMFVCTDSSHYSEQIVGPATQMCKVTGLHPWIISVGDPKLSDAAHESNHVSRLAKDMTRDLGRTVDFDTLHATHIAEEIADYANRHDGAMIAMVTHSRTGFARLKEGSVAMHVVHDATSPVLVVHPIE
ncbi:MAG: universal stress protein [Actinomycetia bacterium]|nr:universal stress protein [Actinomycetes bacterium]